MGNTCASCFNASSDSKDTLNFKPQSGPNSVYRPERYELNGKMLFKPFDHLPGAKCAVCGFLPLIIKQCTRCSS